MEKSPNGDAVATEPTIDVEEIKQLTLEAQDRIAEQSRQEEAEATEVIERNVQQEADRIIADLPEKIHEAASRGENFLPPLIDIRDESDKMTADLVGLWCKGQGLTVHHLPHSALDPDDPPLHTTLHVCWPIQGPYGVRGG